MNQEQEQEQVQVKKGRGRPRIYASKEEASRAHYLKRKESDYYNKRYHANQEKLNEQRRLLYRRAANAALAAALPPVPGDQLPAE
jgi:hypothetical protein